MIVMLANTSGFSTGWLSGTFPNRVGWLLNCADWRGHPKPRTEMPWAIDNGAFAAYTNKKPWDDVPFYKMLSQTFENSPRWVAVPDVVADRESTLLSWECHVNRIKGFKLAFCVQDGMTARDVPRRADVIFVGGTVGWKWATVRGWCADFPRVHVGRVNSEKMLWKLHECGAESCDGTGWFRAGDNFRTNPQLNGLLNYLRSTSKGNDKRMFKQEELF